MLASSFIANARRITGARVCARGQFLRVIRIEERMLKVLHRRQRVALVEREVIALDIMLSVVVMVFTPNRYAAVQVLALVFCVTDDFMAVGVEDCEADRLDFKTILAGSAV